ncbi:MAG: transcriptional repressor LexA [Deltaproteobacteria bacterium]|nr:MAG: transcriptional repressor LexA [Deltaproteobacteria bacterium]
MTDRQRQVLEFIAERVGRDGFPPTLREIGEALGIRSTNGVNDHLKALESKGFIDRASTKSRAIQLTARAESMLGPPSSGPSGDVPDAVSVPLIGRIAAGQPIDAVASESEQIAVDASLLGSRGGEIFALKVCGESMIGEGILDGDVIFVRKQSEARRGEMVAVMVDGAATVKRFYRDGERIRLEPSNPEMEPIWVAEADARDTAVVGKVVAVFRQLAH